MPEFPLKVREDIVPFYFPCSTCRIYRFHRVCEQPTGLAIKLPFMRSPLASTHKACFLACVTCTSINVELKSHDVEMLIRGMIPKSIHSVYPDIQTLYNPALFDQQKAQNLQTMSPEHAEVIDGLVRRYRLEI